MKKKCTALKLKTLLYLSVKRKRELKSRFSFNFCQVLETRIHNKEEELRGRTGKLLSSSIIICHWSPCLVYGQTFSSVIQKAVALNALRCSVNMYYKLSLSIQYKIVNAKTSSNMSMLV